MRNKTAPVIKRSRVRISYKSFSFHLFRSYIPLRIGRHEYSGKEINVEEIRTLQFGLCFKLELITKNTIPSDVGGKPFMISIQSWTQEIDKLSRVYLMLASDNTWQGIVSGRWPYSNSPTIVTGKLKENVTQVIDIRMEEHIWIRSGGLDNITDCLEPKMEPNCTSIFDPYSFTMPIRYNF